MNIEKLELTHFGKFHNKTIKFTSGMNVIYGRNEAGKSTINAFIKSMLFGMSEEDDIYSKYLPWGDTQGYSGSMWISRQGKHYRIDRSFLKNDTYLRLFDVTEGEEEIMPAKNELNELLDGLTVSNYVNTICIEQLKNSEDKLMAEELEQLVINTSQSKSVHIDVESARNGMLERKNQLLEKISPDVDKKFIQNEKEKQSSVEQISSLNRMKGSKDCQYEELEKKLKAESKRADDDMMQYERERTRLRTEYEKAQKEYDNRPDISEKDVKKKSHLWVMFLLIFAACLGAAVYMYVSYGLVTESSLIAITSMAAAAFVAFMLMILSCVIDQRRRKRRYADFNTAQVLEKRYRESLQAFDECRRNLPAGVEQRCPELIENIKQLEREKNYINYRLNEEKEKQSVIEKEGLRLREESVCNKKYYEEIDSINIALKTLHKIAVKLQDTFGSRLNDEASVLISKVTDGKYDRVSVNSDMKVVLYSGDQSVEIEHVSRGTIEQVYLCIRIAAAKLLWQKESMPFLLDDVFAYYDDERMEAAVKMLKETGHQIIIFSCHQREEALL